MPARLCITFQHSFKEATITAEDRVIHQALTSGSGIWQRTEEKPWSSSTASKPCRRWAGLAGWSPVIVSPLCPLVLPALPLLSLPYTGHSSPERLTVTGMLMSSSLWHSVCWWGSLSCPSLSKDRVAVTAAGSLNLLHNHRGSGQAVGAHQLINRAGVVYSRLILPGTGS